MQLLITFFQETVANNQDWLTIEYVKTFSGVSFVIYMLVNMYQKLFNRKPIYIALILSVVLTIYVFSDFNFRSLEVKHIILIPINALFVFSSAFGITQLSAPSAPSNPVGLMEAGTEKKRHFSTSWFN
jgi:ABC-type proline/glycine betaine transport system permease subunit